MPLPIQRRRFLQGSTQLAIGTFLANAATDEVLDYYLPGQHGYETARRPFNADINLKPGIIAACENDSHVVTSVNRAKAKGLPIAVKSRGHSFEGFSLNEGGLVIELSRIAMAEALPDPIFSAFVLNGEQITVLLTSTGPHTGPAFRGAANTLKAAGFTSTGPTRGPLQDAIKRYYGVQTPLPFRNFCGGMANGFADYAPALPSVFDVAQRTGLIIQFNTLGGMISRGGDGAYPHRDRTFLCEVQAYWETPAQREEKLTGTVKVRESLATEVSAHYRNYSLREFSELGRGLLRRQLHEVAGAEATVRSRELGSAPPERTTPYLRGSSALGCCEDKEGVAKGINSRNRTRDRGRLSPAACGK